MRIALTALPCAVTLAACASPRDASPVEGTPVGPYTLDEGQPATDETDAPVVKDVALANVSSKEGQVIPIEGDASVEAPTVHRVLFAEDQWTIGPVGDATIVTAARHIRAHPAARVELVAHADDAIEDRSPMIERRRADAVLERLVEEGVKRSRIDVVPAKVDASDRHDVQVRVYAPSPVAEKAVEPVAPEKMR